jgi:hypothetical protein
MEFKVSYPKGTFRNFNKIHYNETQRPNYLGERVKAPHWWKQAEVIAAFDKVMVDRVSGVSGVWVVLLTWISL